MLATSTGRCAGPLQIPSRSGVPHRHTWRSTGNSPTAAGVPATLHDAVAVVPVLPLADLVVRAAPLLARCLGLRQYDGRCGRRARSSSLLVRRDGSGRREQTE